jgi:hypothetical protein
VSAKVGFLAHAILTRKQRCSRTSDLSEFPASVSRLLPGAEHGFARGAIPWLTPAKMMTSNSTSQKPFFGPSAFFSRREN